MWESTFFDLLLRNSSLSSQARPEELPTERKYELVQKKQ